MSVQPNKAEPRPITNKNTYRFNMGNSMSNRQILITSNFDSGNIELIKQLTETSYRLAAVPDIVGQNRNKKTWFYFKVRAPRYVKLKLVIENVQVLLPGYHAQRPTAKPVFKIGDEGQWNELVDCYLSYRQELEIHIEYTFLSDEGVYFAMSVPFSYLENNDYLIDLESKVRQDVYFHKEILTYSANQLVVNLLTITSQINQRANLQLEHTIHQNMFPDENRPVKINKPVVLIICRVHPGEVSASHTLVAMLNFLCLSSDPRAYLLRRLFNFMVVPMVNPDGVYEGKYRMDTFGNNLNRFYTNPDAQTQQKMNQVRPTIFALKCLVQHLNSEQRLSFILDMHGHCAAKGTFIYGNAFDNIINQTESQVFCKVLSLNSPYFHYEACNFSQKHMKIKDKNEPLTKEGCARVVFGKITNMIHCLTLETGLHTVQRDKWNSIGPCNNSEFALCNMLIKQDKESQGLMPMYKNLGQNVLVTILDVVQKNPYSRVVNSELRSMENVRKNIANSIFQEEERFKLLDLKAYQKTKSITKLIQEVFTDKMERRWFSIQEDLMKISWPQGFDGFRRVKNKIRKGMSTNVVTINHLEAVLTQPQEKRRKYMKSLSPMPRQASKSIADDPLRVTRKNLQFQTNLLTLTNGVHSRSTRKLLRQFRNDDSKQDIVEHNQKTTVKTEPSSNIELKKTRQNPIATISEEPNILFLNQNKEQLHNKLQSRNRHMASSNRVKTETQLHNALVSKSPSKGVVKQIQMDLEPIQLFHHKQLTIDSAVIDSKARKLRNTKREILNMKLSEIRKRSERINLLRLPEIRKIKFDVAPDSRPQEQYMMVNEAVATTLLQIETMKMGTFTKNLIKQ